MFVILLVQAASAAQISLKRSYTEVDTEKKELQLNSKARKYLRFQRHLEKKCEPSLTFNTEHNLFVF